MSHANKSWDTASRLGGLGEALMRRIQSSSAECKVDQFATSTGHLFLETQAWSRVTNRFESSGLSVSLAEFFFLVIGGRPEEPEPGTVTIVVSRQELLKLCTEQEEVEANQKGANPTRGYLLPVTKLLPMGTPQFRSIPCPQCRNRSFRFAGVDDPRGFRECHGPNSCGNVWDAGDAGREIVNWRLPRGG